jgi:hypothetical protein
MVDDLTECWEGAFGKLRRLEEDLDEAKRFFDPVATGRRLRGAIDAVGRSDRPIVDLPSELAVRLPGKRWVVTPEGRVLIDLLTSALHEPGDNVSIDALEYLAALQTLLLRYRGWNRHRLSQVVDLQAGTDRPLQVGPLGLGLLLIVNRNTSLERALPCGPDDQHRQLIDSSVFRAVRAFEATLTSPLAQSKRQRLPEKESIAGGGWMPPELYRRFPFAVLEPRKDAPLLYIQDGQSEALLSALSRELCKRPDVTREHVGVAFDALVRALRGSGSELALYGYLHERSGDTARVREALLERVGADSLQ